MSKWSVTISFFGIGVTLEREKGDGPHAADKRTFKRPYMLSQRLLSRKRRFSK
jgi:hypothetical protein